MKRPGVIDVLKNIIANLFSASTSPYIVGCDYSHWDWAIQDEQGNYVEYYPVNFDTAYLNGARFAVIKVVNGSVVQWHSVDELTRAIASPVCAMPYMWPYPIKYISAQSQAAAWYSVMKNFPGVRIALDAEPTSGYPNPSGADFKACILEYWKLVPDQKFVLYSTETYFAENGFNIPFFDQFPRWLATRNNLPPSVAWAMYQPPYGSIDQPPGNVLPPEGWGVTNGKKKVDIDYFQGAQEELEVFFGGGEVPPEPGDNMTISIGTVMAARLNVRSTPDSSSDANLIGPSFLHANDLVQFDRVENGFGHIVHARRNGVDLTMPGADCWAFIGDNFGYIRPEWSIDVSPDGTPDAEVRQDLGMVVDGVAYVPDHLDGSAVVYKRLE